MVFLKSKSLFVYYYLVETFSSEGQDELEISEDISEQIKDLNLKKGIKNQFEKRNSFLFDHSLILIAFYNDWICKGPKKKNFYLFNLFTYFFLK